MKGISVELINPNQVKMSNFKIINEDTIFPVFPSSKMADFKSIEVDLTFLESLNSIGIREWIHWINQFPESCRINFSNCPKVFIDMAVMITGIAPKNSVFISFLVPYFCEACDDTTTTVKINDLNSMADTQKCVTCGQLADRDLSAKNCKQLQANFKMAF